MITDWKVGDEVVIKDPNFEARTRTITKVGRKLIKAGRWSFRADTYPCRSTGKYNDTLLYRPKDWEFLRAKQRVMNVINDAPMHLRATSDPGSFFKTLNDVLVVIQAEMISWDRYDATEGKT